MISDQLLVDNLWTKSELSTGLLEPRVMHRLSTSYPHLVHRVTNRVIHKLLVDLERFLLRESVANLADVVGQIGVAVGLLGDLLN